MMESWQSKNLLRYVNTKKAQSLATTGSIDAWVVQQAEKANPKILTEAEFVNKSLKCVLEDNLRNLGFEFQQLGARSTF